MSDKLGGSAGNEKNTWWNRIPGWGKISGLLRQPEVVEVLTTPNDSTDTGTPVIDSGLNLREPETSNIEITINGEAKTITGMTFEDGEIKLTTLNSEIIFPDDLNRFGAALYVADFSHPFVLGETTITHTDRALNSLKALFQEVSNAYKEKILENIHSKDLDGILLIFTKIPLLPEKQGISAIKVTKQRLFHVINQDIYTKRSQTTISNDIAKIFTSLNNIYSSTTKAEYYQYYGEVLKELFINVLAKVVFIQPESVIQYSLIVNCSQLPPGLDVHLIKALKTKLKNELPGLKRNQYANVLDVYPTLKQRLGETDNVFIIVDELFTEFDIRKPKTS